ncbi:unnamed protein product [Bathycoccus prasinos]
MSTSTGTTTTTHFEEECRHHHYRYYWSFDEERLANARRRRWNDFGETMKEEEENNFNNYETQFVAFTMSGKPVWSRFGDVVKLSSLVGALSAICAVAEEEEEGEEEGVLDDDGEETVSRECEDAAKKKKKKKDNNRRVGQLHYVEKRSSSSFSGAETTAKLVVVRLAVLRKGALRFAAVSKDPLDTEHVLKVKLETISKAFTFLFGDAIEMNLRRSNHRFDPRKAFFREQEDVYLKSVAESCEGGDAFACTSGRFFRALAMRKERREKVAEVLKSALEKCGDHSKACFAVIYTERKGVVAYASPKTTIRSRGVFEGFNANVTGSPSFFESKRLRAEDVWYLMHHVRAVDRYTMNKKQQDSKGTTSNSTSPRKKEKHSRKASFGEEIVLAGGGIVVKPPPPPPMPSSSFAPAQVTLLEKFKRSFCEDAYDMSICLPSGAEGAKFVLARTMKIRLNEDELVGKEVEYDDSRVKENLDDETMYISIVSKSEDAAARAHESMDELFARMHSQNLLRDIFLATHERENDIVNSIAPALVNGIAYAPSLSDDDEEERESDIALTETAKCAIAKLEHFVYAKPELGQYQIADFEEEEKKKSDGGEKRKRILQKYARMHAAAHYEDVNRKFHDDMLEDIEKSKASDEMLESVGNDGGVGSSSSLSPQSSSEFRGGGFFNFGGLTLNDGGGTGTTESNDNTRLSPMASRILSGLGRSASGTSDTSDDINTSANEKRKTSSSSEQEEGEDEQNQDGVGDSTTHRVRYESDRSGVRIGCFGRDFELFCQFKPNTSCEDAVATTNRLSSHLKARESDMWL